MAPLRTRPAPLAPPALPRVLPTSLQRTRTADDVAGLLSPGLVHIRPGVVTSIPPDADPGSARRNLILARVNACEHLLSLPHWYAFETAALLHGLWTYRPADRVHLAQPTKPRIKRDDENLAHRFRVVRHHVAVPERDRVVVGGVPATSLERTAVGCARSLPFKAALMTMDCALRHGADPDAVDAILREAAGGRGIVQARQVRDLADAGAETPGESLTRGVLLEHGFPPPQTQVRIATRRGTKWADLAWPDALVAIEFDGDIKYTTLAGGNAGLVRDRERTRQAAIERAGWTVVRARWEDIEAPSRFPARVNAALYDRWHLMPEELPMVVGTTRWNTLGQRRRR